MKVRALVLIAATCAAGLIVYAAWLKAGKKTPGGISSGIVSHFASSTLAINLQDYQFGQQLDGSYRPAAGVYYGPPLTGDETLEWYQNAASAAYPGMFPHRNLTFGFKNGRLAAIRVSLTTFGVPAGEERKLAQGDLVNVQDAYYGARREAKAAGIAAEDQAKAPTKPGESRGRDGRYRVQYMPMCGPNMDSLFCASVQITAVR